MATVNPIELKPIERFYRAHADAVYAFLVSLCRDPVWAEDLMQDTFVKATRLAIMIPITCCTSQFETRVTNPTACNTFTRF